MKWRTWYRLRSSSVFMTVLHISPNPVVLYTVVLYLPSIYVIYLRLRSYRRWDTEKLRTIPAKDATYLQKRWIVLRLGQYVAFVILGMYLGWKIIISKGQLLFRKLQDPDTDRWEGNIDRIVYFIFLTANAQQYSSELPHFIVWCASIVYGRADSCIAFGHIQTTECIYVGEALIC